MKWQITERSSLPGCLVGMTDSSCVLPSTPVHNRCVLVVPTALSLCHDVPFDVLFPCGYIYSTVSMVSSVCGRMGIKRTLVLKPWQSSVQKKKELVTYDTVRTALSFLPSAQHRTAFIQQQQCSTTTPPIDFYRSDS